MPRNTKAIGSCALILLISIVAITVLNPIVNVRAQGQATVNILDAIGGTTDPTPGTYSYDGGATVTLTANPDEGYFLLYWIIEAGTNSNLDSDNPTTITVSAATVYSVQPVFSPITIPISPYFPPENATADAIVVVLSAAGGTTNPPPGTYALANATELKLNAVPDNGWKFSHWVISGGPLTGHGGSPFTATPTDNPYTVGHGYGYTFDYQPVFIPVGSPPPGTTQGSGGLSTETVVIIVLAVAIVVILVAFGAYAYSRRKK